MDYYIEGELKISPKIHIDDFKCLIDNIKNIDSTIYYKTTYSNYSLKVTNIINNKFENCLKSLFETMIKNSKVDKNNYIHYLNIVKIENEDDNYIYLLPNLLNYLHDFLLQKKYSIKGQLSIHTEVTKFPTITGSIGLQGPIGPTGSIGPIGSIGLMTNDIMDIIINEDVSKTIKQKKYHKKIYLLSFIDGVYVLYNNMRVSVDDIFKEKNYQDNKFYNSYIERNIEVNKIGDNKDIPKELIKNIKKFL